MFDVYEKDKYFFSKMQFQLNLSFYKHVKKPKHYQNEYTKFTLNFYLYISIVIYLQRILHFKIHKQ